MRNARRTLVAAIAAIGTLTSVAACGGGDSDSSASGSGGAGGTYAFWDPYPQFDASSDWGKLVSKCGTDAGVKIKRTAMDTTDLGNKALLAAQQGNAPDVMLVDNPVVSTLVEAGIVNKTSDLGLDTKSIQQNILGAGTIDGASYGVPIGANTLALYYNKKVLSAAGVDPAAIKDWNSLTAALKKVKAAGKKGITFSAIGTEEGSFQFLPWFWGAGADLTKLDSAKGVAALSLWKGWVDDGLAPKDVLQNTQTTSWQEFATGDYAFGENGTWQLGNAAKAGFEYGVINVPAQNGGSAPVPTGGEFVTVPVQKDTARYDVSKKIVACLTSGANLLSTDTTLAYVAPTAAVQAEQVKANPALKPWVDAVAAARGRTSGGLGTKYPTISQPMWTAVQAALSGGRSPQAALDAAQKAAGKTGS
ncbi:multiple sugar transport system substrate-binding protein [Streptomyces achromogenes]|uniref:Multiple sugar transport system substrate-binding protein n=1 Tax=Streptomyces achromogenes TaxID=67255 RepID=A0ABU0PV24_STRAH|nr:extracellular solute-binding protein [Streptomyces achromogenes]MDQ0682251.1 multiple sugar transport system substrate-binding protein [Streptomyces achromogenes]MDQ0829397.1 multiple sugar transport system substrate-binding protein [Streptomyces achromogenes]